MYQQDRGYYSSQSFSSTEENYDSGYGFNYRNYRTPNEVGLKGKIEQKYWRSKQKVIEKLGKEQDEFVIAGDAEVDSRLEAFQHIKMTCMQLMVAIEFYQNKIFTLSQDENEMGRFLRDQGASDKTKAGKMMIAVGKAQSYAAQQRLGLRASLARLFSELETFRFRAIQDTQITVTKMEQSRSDYRARLLWMADISKELDPDQMKRLDKFRDVQLQVKQAKTAFDKLKGDVVQKIDLLSASRCNLLSAALEAYQSAMITFLSSTSKSYNRVYTQFQGYPSFQFQVLKNIIPNNGIVDEDIDEEEEEDIDNTELNVKEKESKSVKVKSIESPKDIRKVEMSNRNLDESDDKLINFDTSPSFEVTALQPTNVPKVEQNGDLLGSIAQVTHTNDTVENKPSIDDLLFGVPEPTPTNDNTEKSDMEILSDVLNNHSLGINDMELNNSFSSQWQSMFGSADVVEPESVVTEPKLKVDTDADNHNQMFMPSFLLDQIGKSTPIIDTSSKSASSNKDTSKNIKVTSSLLGNKKNEPLGKDMSKWFSLFADLDPLSNPDAIGGVGNATDAKQAC